MMSGTEIGHDATREVEEPMGIVSSPATGTGVRRLEPVDGLFLRADHLEQIQEHSLALALLGAAAGGPGVVYGYGLDLDGAALGCSPGLAFDPTGTALRTTQRLELDLGRLDHDPGRVWVVELVPGEPIPSGSEPLYSAVCGDPCGPGSSVPVWSETSVRLRVRPETLDTSSADHSHLVSAAASAWFERERRDGDPWPTPTVAEAVIPRLADRPWSAPAPANAPGSSGVPLGLLVRRRDSWYVDVWSARRDRVHTPPEAAWVHRLGRRPENVFTAQVLQFEDQLSQVGVSPGNPLPDHFVELPPAGFLPWPRSRPEQYESDHALLDALFGGAVRLDVSRCTADVALSALELAHDLDRIPLSSRVSGDLETDLRPRVQVLVPSIGADLPAVRTQDYPWVVFVRAPRLEGDRVAHVPQDTHSGPIEVVPADEGHEIPDTVEAVPVLVHVVSAPRARTAYASTIEGLAEEPPLIEVRFGPDFRPADAPEVLRALRAEADGGGDYSTVDVVIGTADPGREPALAARARALAAECWPDEGGSVIGGIYAERVTGPDLIALMPRRR